MPLFCCCWSATEDPPPVVPPPPPAPPSEPEEPPINPIVLSKRSGSRRGGTSYVTDNIPSSSNFTYSPFASPPADAPTTTDAPPPDNAPTPANNIPANTDPTADAPSTTDPPSLPPYCGAPFCTVGEHRRALNTQVLQLDKNVVHRVPLLDHVTALVRTLLDVSICIIDFVDHEQMYIKSAQNWAHSRVGDRRFSICTWMFTTLHPEVLVVEDLTKDGRFMNHPVVVDPTIALRFFCGVPLVSSVGERLGTLCVLDYQPRVFCAACCKLMINFAELVIPCLEEGGLSSNALTESASSPKRPIHRDLNLRRRVALINTKDPDWPVLDASDQWVQGLGLQDKQVVGNGLMQLVTPARPKRMDAYRHMAAQGLKFPVTVITAAGDTLYLHMRPVYRERAFDDMPTISVSVSPAKTPNAKPAGDVQGLYFAILTHERPPQPPKVQIFPEVPFADVRLGPLLGVGSHGRVYRAYISDMPVAAKVISHTTVDRHTSAAAVTRLRTGLEALIGMRLRHPNIVQHIDFAVVTTMHALMDSAAARAAGMDVLAMPIDTATAGAHDTEPTSTNGVHDTGGDMTASCMPSLKTAATNDDGHISRHSSLEIGLTDAAVRQQGVPLTGAHEMCTWILMEYCAGDSLQAAIDRGTFREGTSVFEGTPDLHRILPVALQVANAMHYLHEQGVVHGDLCPRNVMCTQPAAIPATTAPSNPPPLCVKVGDFGLSRELINPTDGIPTSTHGTVTHMPPETLLQGSINKATDVYSFGVMLWELYMTRRPYAGYNAVQVCAAKLLHKETLTMAEGTPEAYKTLALQCMGPPDQRPTFATLIQALEAMQRALDNGQLHTQAFPAWEDPDEEQAKAQTWRLGEDAHVDGDNGHNPT